MNYSRMEQTDRDIFLKAQLSEDMVKLIERYRLKSTEQGTWISKKENSHEHIIFNHKYLLKTDILGALFRINYLCFAKLKYFRDNLNKYEPLIYHPTEGFKTTELYNSDFLKHKATGRIFDYRFFQRITDIKVFKDLCIGLEALEK